MDKKEYQIRLEEIENQSNLKKRQLQKDFALSNNPYKIGDILEDHCHRIKVTDFKIEYSFTGLPSIMFTGIELTKGLIPTKRQNNIYLWQNNVLAKLN